MSDSRFTAGSGWTQMPPEGVPLPAAYRIAAPIGAGARWRCDQVRVSRRDPGEGLPFEDRDETNKLEHSARMSGGRIEILAPEGTELMLSY